MKKTTILLIVFTIISSNVIAQKKWKIGFTLGPNLSKYIYSKGYVASFPKTNSKYGIGLSTGINLYRLYGKNLMLKTGIPIQSQKLSDASSY